MMLFILLPLWWRAGAHGVIQSDAAEGNADADVLHWNQSRVDNDNADGQTSTIISDLPSWFRSLQLRLPRIPANDVIIAAGANISGNVTGGMCFNMSLSNLHAAAVPSPTLLNSTVAFDVAMQCTVDLEMRIEGAVRGICVANFDLTTLSFNIGVDVKNADIVGQPRAPVPVALLPSCHASSTMENLHFTTKDPDFRNSVAFFNDHKCVFEHLDLGPRICDAIKADIMEVSDMIAKHDLQNLLAPFMRQPPPVPDPDIPRDQIGSMLPTENSFVAVVHALLLDVLRIDNSTQMNGVIRDLLGPQPPVIPLWSTLRPLQTPFGEMTISNAQIGIRHLDTFTRSTMNMSRVAMSVGAALDQLEGTLRADILLRPHTRSASLFDMLPLKIRNVTLSFTARNISLLFRAAIALDKAKFQKVTLYQRQRLECLAASIYNQTDDVTSYCAGLELLLASLNITFVTMSVQAGAHRTPQLLHSLLRAERFRELRASIQASKVRRSLLDAICEALTLAGTVVFEQYGVHTLLPVINGLLAFNVPLLLNPELKQYVAGITTDPPSNCHWSQHHKEHHHPPRSLAVGFAQGVPLVCLAAVALVFFTRSAHFEKRGKPSTPLIQSGSTARKLAQTTSMRQWSSHSMPCALGTTAGCRARAAIALCILCNMALFAFALMVPALRVTFQLGTQHDIGMARHDPRPFTILNASFTKAVTLLWTQDNGQLFALALVVLSAVCPMVKLVLLLICWVAPSKWLPTHVRGAMLHGADSAGKASLFFVFVCISIARVIHIEWGSANGRIRIAVTLLSGLSLFLAAVIASHLLGHAVYYVHTQKQRRATKAHGSGIDVVTMRAIRSHVRIKWDCAVLFLATASVTCVIIGSCVHASKVHFAGVLGNLLHMAENSHATPAHQSAVDGALDMTERIPGLNANYNVTMHIVTAVYYVLTLTAPLLFVPACVCLWVAPLNPQRRHMAFFCAAVINAWQAIGVFVLAQFIVLRYMDIVVDIFVQHGHLAPLCAFASKMGTSCLAVNTELKAGSWVLLAGASFLFALGRIVLGTAEKYTLQSVH